LIAETNYTWEAKNSAYKNRVTQQIITKKGIGTTFSDTVKFEYDAKARLTKKIDYSGNAKSVTTDYSNYDSFGNPRTLTASAANCPTVTASLTFDATGRFAETFTDVLGNVSSARYDASTGVLLENTDIASLKTTYQYDGFRGQTTLFQYDAAGRITQEFSPERTLVYQYVPSGNGIGQIQTIKQNNAIVRSYGYTPLLLRQRDKTCKAFSITNKLQYCDNFSKTIQRQAKKYL